MKGRSYIRLAGIAGPVPTSFPCIALRHFEDGVAVCPPLSAEIVMPGASNAHEALGRLDKGIQPLAENNRNDIVVLAVHHQVPAP
jgi:hypothetical protein